MTTVSLYTNPSLKLLLNGDLTLSPEINNIITLKVQKYIIDSHRFSRLSVSKHTRLVLYERLLQKKKKKKKKNSISLRPISHILQVMCFPFFSFLFFFFSPPSFRFQ